MDKLSKETNCKHLCTRNWRPFSKMADRNKTVNISASSSLRIVILVSKRTYLGARIIGVTFYCDGGVRSPPLLKVVVIVTTTFWSYNEIYFLQ